MKAIKYEIEVTNDIVHGWKAILVEYHFPELNLFINNSNCFILTDFDRNWRLKKAKNKQEIDFKEDCFSNIAKNIIERKKLEEECYKLLSF